MQAVRGVLIVAALVVFAPNPAGAQERSSIVLPKAGQVGLSIGGGYGSLLEGGNVGTTFGSGPTFTVRLRYRMRYERAVAASFETQALDVRVEPGVFDPLVPSTIAPRKLSLILSGVEFYQMFDTRERTQKMLMVGAGLAQMRADMNSGEVELSGQYSGDGLFVSAGAGIERFFYRSWAFDVSTRYYAVFRDGQANHDVQGALGVIFYASY